MMMTRKAIYSVTLAVALSVALSACTAIHPPAPQLPTRLNVAASGEMVTASGRDSIYAIAKAHNVSMRDMIVLNNLQPPFTLKPGQMLKLPAGGTGGVAGGMIGDANMPAVLSAPTSGVDSAVLAPSSGMPSMNESVQSQSLEPLPPAKTPVSTSPVVNAPPKMTQVDVLNKPSPAPKTVNTTVINAPQPSKEISALPPATPKTVPVPPPVEAAKPTVDKAVAEKAAAEKASVDADAAAPEFVWPVQGPILSTFGSKGQGLSNDGINIGAPKGAPVVAAAGGMVVYAGNEMKGFGNLILIRHQGGWVTAYAHLDRIIATKDSIVAAGDMIATVGKTGNVPSAQLHFEVRHNGKTVDPSKLISH